MLCASVEAVSVAALDEAGLVDFLLDAGLDGVGGARDCDADVALLVDAAGASAGAEAGTAGAGACAGGEVWRARLDLDDAELGGAGDLLILRGVGAAGEETAPCASPGVCSNSNCCAHTSSETGNL